jgi:GlpG protein
LWIRSRRDPTSPYFVDDRTVLIMVAWFFICILGLVGPIANTAHGAGLLGGMAVGYAYAVIRRRGMRGRG